MWFLQICFVFSQLFWLLLLCCGFWIQSNVWWDDDGLFSNAVFPVTQPFWLLFSSGWQSFFPNPLLIYWLTRSNDPFAVNYFLSRLFVTAIFAVYFAIFVITLHTEFWHVFPTSLARSLWLCGGSVRKGFLCGVVVVVFFAFCCSYSLRYGIFTNFSTCFMRPQFFWVYRRDYWPFEPTCPCEL